jgi:NhaP-type Na+/H+ or K+/H+ antiporter
MVILSLAVGSDVSGFSEAKFIGALIFGYTCSRVWGSDRPTTFLNGWWFFMQPFLFGTIGATLFIAQLNAKVMSKGVGCIFCGLTVRVIAAFCVSVERKYNWKDKLFMAVTWIPKATVQAVLGSVLLTDATHLNIPAYKEYGQII